MTSGWGWTVAAVFVGLVLGLGLSYGVPEQTSLPVARALYCDRDAVNGSVDDNGVRQVLCAHGEQAGDDVTAMTVLTVCMLSIAGTGAVAGLLLRLTRPRPRRRRRWPWQRVRRPRPAAPVTS